MKKRLIFLFLTLITILGLLPTAAFAASTPEEALGEINIYNGGVEMSYLSINGRVRTQEYTYYNFVDSNGKSKEIPAYCVDPNIYGVPQTVSVGEYVKYLAEEVGTDPKAIGIVANGYPTRGLAELKLENRFHAYYATKMALWSYILPNWDINNLKVNPSLTGLELQRAQAILAAAKDIYVRGTQWSEVLSPEITCTPDRECAYPVTIDGEQYKQQIFTYWSKTWVCDYTVRVSFATPSEVPPGTRIVDMNNQDITAITTQGTGNGYAGKFKVLYPVESIAGKTGSVQLAFQTDVYKYGVFYAICAEKNKYGELQNYLVDTDPTVTMRLAAHSTYDDDTATAPPDDITALRILKYESGTEIPIKGALFEVIDPKGSTVGLFSSDSDGHIFIPLSLSGNYTVIERASAEHHLLSKDPAQNVIVEYGKTAELIFYNDPYGSLHVEKRSNTGMKLPGAVIQIRHIESGKTYTAESNFAGVAIFSPILPGAYEILEKTAPLGWLKDESVHTVVVGAGEPTEYTLVNQELPGLRIIKYDRENHLALSGVTFSIWRDGEYLGDYVTDQMGEILITNAKPGTYRASEKDTGNPGLILDTTPQEIELKAGDGIRELLFFNDRTPGLYLTKVDSQDPSIGIPNAIFTIESVKGDYGPEEFRTDANGVIDLTNEHLPVGAYIITEISCAGYVVDDGQRVVYLDPNEDAEYIFTNHKLPSLHLIKHSADGSALKGVSFRLAKIEDGSYYLDRTTDSKGEILWEGLEPGIYSLKEISTLPDHILDPREYHIELFPGQTSTKVLTNNKRINLYIHKSDADTGAPIPGTVYLVKGADGHSIAEVKTNEEGVAVVPNLLPSVVEIIEKSVPEPYLLAEESQMATLYPNRDRHIYFENHKRPVIEILKVNKITQDPIEHVKMQVWYASNNTSTGEYNDLGIYYTDAEGRIILSDPALSLRDGWFRISELEPAPGFALPEQDTQGAFIAAGEGHTFVFENTPLSAICVWKYDSVHPNVAIEGAVFQVRYLSGNTSGTGGTVIGTYRTSANGAFTVTNCKAGTYIIEELSSDGSHVIDTPPQTVYLSGKEQEVVQIFFGNSPKGSVLIKKVSSTDRTPLSDVQFFVTDATGAIMGDGNGYFTTDSAGSILIDDLDPGTTLIIKETRSKPGYLLDDTPVTATVKAGQTVTVEVRNQPQGNLIIEKLSGADKKTRLEGVRFKITYADGRVVDAEGGKLSSNGIYYTDKNGQIVLSGITGTLVITEEVSIDGYTIDPNTQSQTVVVNPDDTQTIRFYNNPIGGIELVKVSASDRSHRIPNTTFEIRRAGNDALITTVTTDKTGRCFVPLEDGSYYAVEVEAGKGFLLDDTPIYFEITNGVTVTKEIKNKAISQIIIHKIDSRTEEGIYGVKFLLYDSDKNPLGEYVSDDEGYVYIQVPDGLSGRLYLRELEAADGYTLDKEYKTVNMRPGKTIEIEWENTAVTGQIQIYKYAAEHNAVTGTPAGAPLQGAVYEIINERSGKVVDYITTDARGVAASNPLPLARYKIVEVTAPAYWQLDPTVHDVTLEFAGQIIKISAYDKPSNLGVTITKRGNAEVMAGQTMRYDITVANTSNVPLDSFFWHDKIPYDVARATTLTTGTYSARLNYRILYKTNYQSAYQVLASNLLTTNNYTFSLNAIPLQAGEAVTDVYIDFGKIPVGFQSTVCPTLSVIVNGNTVNGYQMVNRADAGGKYQGTWQTAQANWVTVVRRFTTTPTLPQTGY